MQREDYAAEGTLQVGPAEKYFVFLDGEYLGKSLPEHFKLPTERGYTEVGRVRITVEVLNKLTK